MSAQKIGWAKSCKGNKYEVFRNSMNREVYVKKGEKYFIGKATNAGQAMNMAEAWLRNK